VIDRLPLAQAESLKGSAMLQHFEWDPDLVTISDVDHSEDEERGVDSDDLCEKSQCKGNRSILFHERETMRDHYDFSKGVKGKFSGQTETLRLPIYLDPEVEAAMEQLAISTGKEVNDLANSMLKNDLELLKAMSR